MNNKAIGESSFISLIELAEKQRNYIYIPQKLSNIIYWQNIKEGRKEGDSVCGREKRKRDREERGRQ